MQVCFFKLSRRAARGRGHRPHQGSRREDLRAARQEVVAAATRGHRRRARQPAPHRDPGGGAGRMRPPLVAPAAPDFVKRVTRGDDGGQAATCCPSARSRSTARCPSPPPSGRSATSRWRSRCGTDESASSAASASLVCPHAAIRVKVYDPAQLAGAPATFKSTDCRKAGRQGPEVHAAGRAGGLHRLRRCASRSARPRTRPSPNRKAINMAPQPPLREAGARELRVLPRPAGARPPQGQARHDQGHRSSCSRCSSTPARAPAAARRRTSSC